MKKILSLLVTLIIIGSFQTLQGQSIDTVRVFPNPVSDTLNVYFVLNKADTISIKVIDMAGRVQLEPISDSVFLKGSYLLGFEVSSLDSGLYLCVLNTKSGENKTVKFTKDYAVTISSIDMENISIYPNPVNHILNIPDGLLMVEVFDMMGNRLVSQLNPNSTLNMGFLPTGSYVVVLHNEQGLSKFSIIKN